MRICLWRMVGHSDRSRKLMSVEEVIMRLCSINCHSTMSKDAPHVDLAPRTTSYDFFGPPGALFVTLTVPAITYGLYFGCSESNGCTPNLSTISDQIVASVTDPDWWISLWDTQASLIYLAWYAYTVVAWFVLPGDWIQGTTLRTGEKKSYKLNGMTR